MIESPCKKICKLDASGVCLGCGRTGSEIAAWRDLPEPRQREIAETARRRLETLSTRTRAAAK